MCQKCATNSRQHAAFSGTMSFWLFISSTRLNHMVTQWSTVITQLEWSGQWKLLFLFRLDFLWSLQLAMLVTAVIGIAVHKLTTMQRIIFPMCGVYHMV